MPPPETYTGTGPRQGEALLLGAFFLQWARGHSLPRVTPLFLRDLNAFATGNPFGGGQNYLALTWCSTFFAIYTSIRDGMAKATLRPRQSPKNIFVRGVYEQRVTGASTENPVEKNWVMSYDIIITPPPTAVSSYSTVVLLCRYRVGCVQGQREDQTWFSGQAIQNINKHGRISYSTRVGEGREGWIISRDWKRRRVYSIPISRGGGGQEPAEVTPRIWGTSINREG